MRVSMSELRAFQSQKTRAERNKHRRLEQAQSRKFVIDRGRANYRQRQQVHLAFTSAPFLRLVFKYEPDIKYYVNSKTGIDAMDKKCPHCDELKFKNVPAGLFFVSGKLKWKLKHQLNH